jgi:PAS domain S-box-containing protein
MPSTLRFTVILSVIAVATITLTTVLLLMQLRDRELRHAKDETVSLSNVIAEQTTRALQSVDLALRVAQHRLEQAEKQGVSLDSVAIHTMLESISAGMPHVKALFIVDASGKVTNSSRIHPIPRLAVTDREYFTVPRDQPEVGLFVGSPNINRSDGKWTLNFSRRIANRNGEFTGIIAASLNLDYFELIYSSIRLDVVSPISLHLSDGTLIAREPHDELSIGRKSFLPDLPLVGKASLTPVTVKTVGEDSGIATYRRISQFPLVLSVGNRDKEALAEWRSSSRIIIAETALAVLLVLAATVLLLRKQRHEETLANAARESDDQLRAMVDSAMDAIITIDSERRIVVFNPAAQSMFGYSLEEVHGSPLDRLLPERFRRVHEGNIAAFRNSGVTARMKKARMEIVGLRADGSEFPLESTIAQVTIGGQAMFTAILRDISERRRTEDELRESNKQLRELATSLQAVREEERTSIARELHDELGQQLLRLRMDLDWLAGRLKDLAPALHEKVDAMKHFIAGTVDALRHVTTRLRPPLLDDLGLMEAVRWQLDEFSQRTGIDVESNIAIGGITLDESTSINVFRILQEALTNVARHAGATQVNVSLARTPECLALEIRDNGFGTELRDKPQLGHGLVGIRERTLLLGGYMEIVSAPREGFAIMVRIPLRAAESAGEQI